LVYRRTDRIRNTLKGQVLANVLANVLLPQNSQGFAQARRSRAGLRRPAQKFGAAKHRISSMPWSVEKTQPKNTPSQPDQHQYLRQQRHQHQRQQIHHHPRHHIARDGAGQDQPFFVRTNKTLFLAPSQGAKTRKARRPSKDGRDRGHRAAARSHAQPALRLRAWRASWTAEHM
jgi:hypothetical protein